ncbi:hypothetical protein [Saccharopolyspora sp. 6M]|uniref:hypothetical protein n=1 Tax=Saccharopolyspora sp. 6M TaxID=2877237 RepID=UPI001CD2E116|nr:hypothetical protein [Saccharopolyspora sp. 6M]MCA1224668.1 hypothetical protein [Saccharopolyspora sp. 6M]
MQLVVATEYEEESAELERFLGGRDDIRVRCGTVPDVAVECDFMVVKFYLAHDRYGGYPRPGEAQLLVNTREDGLPKKIVATPPFFADDNSTNAKDVKRRLREMLGKSFDLVKGANGEISDASVLVHREALGLDSFTVGEMAEAILVSID